MARKSTLEGLSMGAMDELKDLETRVTERIRELEAAVSELDELRAVARRLGIDVPVKAPTSARGRSGRTKKTTRTPKSATTGKAPRRASRQTQRRRGSSAAGRSSRRDDVLKIVKRRPG